MSHVVKTIKIKRGAKMHILANGAGRNLRSTITNHLNIRIMKQITKAQIVELMENILSDGIDYSSYHIERYSQPISIEKSLGFMIDGDEHIISGNYCVICADSMKCENIPNISEWIYEKLADDNYMIFAPKRGKEVYFVICLEQ